MAPSSPRRPSGRGKAPGDFGVLGKRETITTGLAWSFAWPLSSAAGHDPVRFRISLLVMRRPRRLLALACAAVALAATALAAPLASAASNPVISDCSNNGRLTHTYTLAELRHALATLPASTKEYTNCSDVLNQAIVAALRTGSYSGGSGKSSGGSFLPTPVIVILVVLILAALTFGGLAVRRRRQKGAPPGAPAR